MIRMYQLTVSPLLGDCCRFYPSCSNYALQALEQYRFTKAITLITKRLLRCHPFNQGGIDELSKRDPNG